MDYAGAAKKAMAAPTWKGKGGYTYTLLDDDSVQVLDSNGQVTYARPNTPAQAAIMKEYGRQLAPPEDVAYEDAPSAANLDKAREAEMKRKAPSFMETP